MKSFCYFFLLSMYFFDLILSYRVSLIYLEKWHFYANISILLKTFCLFWSDFQISNYTWLFNILEFHKLEKLLLILHYIKLVFEIDFYLFYEQMSL